ncbi:hypothetical protein CR513_41167, partial [Mucuna pruriens]
MAKNNFQNLYKEEGVLEEVERPFFDDEIQSTVFNVVTFKASSQMSYTQFFSKQIGPFYYYEPNRNREINRTLLALIPKCNAPTYLHQFHLINLCNVIYKIITKIIVTRLKNFMPILEILHSMHKKGKVVLSLLKWILRRVPTIEFLPSRGVTQGDQILPYLFVLCMERIAHLIEREVSCNNWIPIKFYRTGSSISHLNVHNSKAMELSHISGNYLTRDLGKYLGVPMLHGRKKRETCAYVLERTQHHISRCTLANLFLLISCKLFCSQNRFVIRWKELMLGIIFSCQKMWEVRQRLITNPNALLVRVLRMNGCCTPNRSGPAHQNGPRQSQPR